MKIVLLVEHALMSALLKQSKKATFMSLIPKFALIVVLAPMFVLLKQFTRNKVSITDFQKKEAIRKNSLLLFYCTSLGVCKNPFQRGLRKNTCINT